MSDTQFKNQQLL